MEKMTYKEWKADIVKRLVGVGFPENEAVEESGMYGGLYHNDTTFEEPQKVVGRVLKRKNIPASSTSAYSAKRKGV